MTLLRSSAALCALLTSSPTLAVAQRAQPAQPAQPRDSAEVVRLLTSLRNADSAVCELAGRALTDMGGLRHGAWDVPMPMPMPMPMPTPMPFAGRGDAGHMDRPTHGSWWAE